MQLADSCLRDWQERPRQPWGEALPLNVDQQFLGVAKCMNLAVGATDDHTVHCVSPALARTRAWCRQASRLSPALVRSPCGHAWAERQADRPGAVRHASCRLPVWYPGSN